MAAEEIAATVIVGFLAGAVAGLLGVGGGILFVPLLSALGLTHLEAEATSLLAIIPVALVGAWRQHGYGNLRTGDGVAVGLLSFAGVVLGVGVANAVPERALEIAFAALTLYTAYRLAAPADGRGAGAPGDGPGGARE